MFATTPGATRSDDTELDGMSCLEAVLKKHHLLLVSPSMTTLAGRRDPGNVTRTRVLGVLVLTLVSPELAFNDWNL